MTTTPTVESVSAQAATFMQPIPDAFEPFPKIPRLSREMVISEKLDGTNASILFQPDGSWKAGSRNRWLSSEADNYGFYSWVNKVHDYLFKLLGVGRHFGEWWGCGIQRTYDKNTKCFSLFNVSKWGFLADPEYIKSQGQLVLNGVPVSCVPVLATGLQFDTEIINLTMQALHATGSRASPGYMNPEGIVVYHKGSNCLFKKTFEHDEMGKGE